jgi:glycosyltransferase involved in cell wall biosynthesis
MKCGIGDYTDCLARALTAAGVEVAVLTSEAAAAAPHPYELLAVGRSWDWRDLPRVARAMRRWRPDVVHLQYPTQAFAGRHFPWFLGVLARALRFRLVQTWHEYVGGVMPAYIPPALAGGGVVAVRPRFRETLWPVVKWLTRSSEFRFIPGASAIPLADVLDDEREAIRRRWAGGRALVVYFGFVYPAKGVEQLFDIVDERRHQLVLACDLDPRDDYQRAILERNAGRWPVTGFLPRGELAGLLAAADAVVMPFRDGGGIWNSSLHAASRQGTFVLITSCERRGYDAAANIYFAEPGNVEEMRAALLAHAGTRGARAEEDEWERVAREHVELYRVIVPEAFA